MINNLDGKSKKELIEIVQIQMDEYQKLQQSNDEAQLLIGLLDAEVEKLKYEWYRRDLIQQAKGVMRVMACKELNLSEGEIDTLILIKEQLRQQASKS